MIINPDVNYTYIYSENLEENKILNYMYDNYGTEKSVYKKSYNNKKKSFQKEFIRNLIFVKQDISTGFIHYSILTGLFPEFYNILITEYNIPSKNIIINGKIKNIFDFIKNISVKQNIRDYQKEYCLQILLQERGIIVSPVGSGKSLMMAMILSALRELKAIILVPSLSLITQIYLELTKEITDYKIITVEKLLSNKYNEEKYNAVIGLPIHFKKCIEDSSLCNLSSFPLLIGDECFPAGTVINNKKIEDLKIGDKILSYNHELNIKEYKKIIHIFKSIPKSLVKINFKYGQEIICTPNHPFFNGKEYISAINLRKGDILFHDENSNLCSMQEISESKNKNKKSLLSYLRKLILFYRLQKNIFKSTIKQFENKNTKSNFIRENEKEQSNVFFRNSRKSKSNIEKEKTQTSYSRRKWQRINDASIVIIGKNELCFNPRIYNQNKYEEIFGVSESLQNRFSLSRIFTSYRNRWKKSWYFRKENSGSKENGFFNADRVESIEILEPTSDGKFNGLCSDGFVYNIEVEDNNNYFVNNKLVHNCHQYAASIAKQVILAQQAPYRFGFTATPTGRSDGQDKVVLGLFGPIIELVSYDELVENKFVPNINIEIHQIGWNEDYIYMEDLLIVHNSRRNEYIAELTKNHLYLHKDGLVLILVRRLEHIKELEKYFSNIPYVTISGEIDERDDIIDDIKKGKYKIVIASSVLSQGVSIPNFTLGINAAGGKAAIATYQKSGRMARGDISSIKKWIDLYDTYTNVVDTHSFNRVKTYFENYKNVFFRNFNDKKLLKIKNDLNMK